ncbi:MAG: tandem-95 repeat protein [Agarilytica sp.]
MKRVSHILQSFTLLSVLASAANAVEPTITSTAPTDININQTYTYQVEAHDPEGGALSYAFGFQPPGMTVSAEGLISWVPTTEDAGKHVYKIEVEDDEYLNAHEYVTVNVIDPNNQPPVFNGTPITHTYINELYDFDVQATDPDGDSLVYSVASWPEVPGLSIDVNGRVTWTPNNTHIGVYWVWVIADDQRFGETTLSFELRVTDPANNAPVIANEIGDVNVNVGQTFTYDLQAADADGDQLNYALQIWPEVTGATISTTGVVEWTPALENIEEHYVVVSVNDGKLGEDTHSFKLTVINTGNTPPSITSTPQTSIEVGNLYQYDIEAIDPDNTTLNYSLIAFPSGMTIDSATGLIAWTPSSIGDYLIELAVSDGINPATTQSYTLNVIPPANTAPTASDSQSTTDEDSPTTIALSATDPEGDVLTYTILTTPAHGTLSGTVPNLTYTPNANIFGSDQFTFQVTDGVLVSNIATVDIDVVAVNDAPVVNDISFSGVEDTLINITLSANDIDGDELAYEVISPPTNGILSGIAPNLVYTPHTHYNGTDTFTFEASDNLSASTATVTLIVEPVNDAPVVILNEVSTVSEGENFTHQIFAEDADGDELTYAFVASPSNMTIDPSSGLINWLTTHDDSGSHLVQVSISDNFSEPVTDDFNVTVENVNRSPVFVSVPELIVEVGEQYTYNIDLTDADGDALTLEIQTGPEDITLDQDLLLLSWIPSPADEGVNIIELLARDSEGAETLQAYFLTVQPAANMAPIFESEATTRALESHLYQYHPVIVDDYDTSDEITLELSDGPQGMIIDNLGSLIWVVPEGSEGDYSVSLTATDSEGLVTYQNFFIHVEKGREFLSHKGRSFWSSKFRSPLPGHSTTLYITSDQDTTGEITFSSSGESEPFTVEANQITTIEIDDVDGVMLFHAHDKVINDAFHIVSEQDIVAYALVYQPFIADAYTLLPEHALGQDYFIMSYENTRSGSSVLVTAVEDDTTVSLSFRERIRHDDRWFNPGESIEVSLDAGQSYYYEYHDAFNFDMTGTEVNADKPISVLGAHECPYVPVGYSACDVLIEQLLPLGLWSNDYILAPLIGRLGGDTVRILASEDNTQVYINQNLQTILNKGEFYETFIEEPSHITANELIQVAQFSNGSSFDESTWEQVQPNFYYERDVQQESEFFLSEYDITIPPAPNLNAVMVIIPTENEDTLLINNEPLAGNYFVPSYLPEALGYSVAQIALPPGDHHLSSSVVFGVYQNMQSQFRMSDPFMAIIPGVQQFLSQYSFIAPTGVLNRHYINITAPINAIDTFVLNGARIDPNYFSEVENTDYAMARIAINAQEHTISAALPFGIMVYGADADTSYGYIGGVGVSDESDVDSMVVELSANSIELNEELCVLAIVEDSNSDLQEQVAVDFNVTGVNQFNSRRFTNADGQAQWCYTGYRVGEDSVTVTAGSLSQTETIDWLARSDGANSAPLITSTPSLVAEYNQAYSYLVTAFDANQDSLSYALVTGPVGMTMDSASGELSWPISSGVLDNRARIVVSVSDGQSATEQGFVLHINSSPQVNATPIDNFEIGFVSNTIISATDADGDTVTFDLVEGPESMTLEKAGGRINYGDIGVGTYPIAILLSDGEGGETLYEYELVVRPFNAPPIFTNSTYNFQTVAGEELQYALNIVDPEGHDFTISASFSHLGQRIDQELGLFIWTPGANDTGFNPVTVSATDSEGRTRSQLLRITVIANEPPTFTEIDANDNTRLGQEYSASFTAVDPEGSPITYSLGATGTTAQIDATTGIFTWQPTETGTQLFSVIASDGSFTSHYSWSVNVLGESDVFNIGASLDQVFVNEGDTINLSSTYVNALDAVVFSLTQDGSLISINADGSAQISAQNIGAHTLHLTATDGFSTSNLDLQYYVGDPDDSQLPIAQLIAPVASGSDVVTITNVVDVVATATDANLAEYTLRLWPKHTPSAVRIIEKGFSNQFETKIADLDPTVLTNGLYILHLTVTDTSGQSSSDSVIVQVDGDLKVGNFSFTVRDLTVPLAGIPIEIKRTYDSRRRYEALDFGYGWSLDYQNVRVEESRIPGDGWALSEYPTGPNGILINYCVEPLGVPVVTVTLPNGDVERFNVSASPQCNTSIPILDVDLVFTAEGDTQSTLASSSVSGGRLVDDRIEILGDGFPIDPDRYRLTTRAGYIYHLNQNFGIEMVEDPNGHTITYSDSGIAHSSGKAVTFERNEDGYITDIIDPAGERLVYTQDLNGDLRFVTERDSSQVQYTYNADHGLIDIIDPLDRRVMRNLYDADGRLYGQEDADGNVKTFTHDLEAGTSLVTNLDGRSTLFNYDDRGNVLQDIKVITDGSYTADIVTEYTYDANDNQETKTIGASTWTTLHSGSNDVESSCNPLNECVAYTNYNARGQEGTITDERGHTYVMSYDAAGNLTDVQSPEITDPDTGEVSQPTAGNVINAQGLVESTTDLRSMTTTYTYYPSGHANEYQKHTETNPVSGTITYSYDDNNNVISEARERTVNGSLVNETTTYAYDARDRVIRTTHDDGSYSETEYDLVGNADRERDRFGNWTDFTYDIYGRLTQTDYADGTSESRTYTLEGLLHTVTDRMGRVTRNIYDDAGRLTQVHNDTDATYTETRYNEQGWVIEEYDALRNLTEYEYDLAGRRAKVIRHIDGVTQEHSFTYYPNGELHTETDALNRTTTYILNELDQRIEVQYHNGSSMEERFDFMGTRTQSIDQESRTTAFGYDDIGRLSSVTPLVNIDGEAVPATSYTYDEKGNRLTQTDAEGRTTTWTYDLHGRVLTRQLPEGMSESFVYTDGQGCQQADGINCGSATSPRTTVHTDFIGDTITTAFDVMGRTISVEYSKDGNSEVYSYYANDQVHTVTDQHGITEYFYDVNDRLEREIKPDGTQMDYSYDAVGNRTSVSVTRNSIVTSSTSYTYDDLNRLDTAVDASGTTDYDYDAVGNLQYVTYPNGLQTEYVYNTINQLTDVFTRDPLNTVISHFNYTLTPTGRREVITELDGRTTTYGYDNLYRLTSEAIADAINGDYNATYEYDMVGNREYETVDGVQTAYSYDLNDRLTQTGGTVYEYDHNGNTLTETLDGNVKTYTWDGKNKLTSLDNAGARSAYTYNHNGIRTSKTESGVTTDFIVDENTDYAQVLEEVVSDTTTVAYSYGHDLINQDRAGSFSYYHYDGLGSTRSLSDDLGSLTDEYDYEAFGEVLNETGSTVNNYKFTGEQYDAGLGQYYLRARYYDQGIGRFTQMDTWMGINDEPITLNKYLYANVDPGNRVDPTGHFAGGIGGQMAAIGGLAILGGIAVNSYSNLLSLDRTASPGFDGVLTNKEMGILVLLMMGSNSTLWNMVFKDDGESDQEKMERIDATPIPETGDGKYKVLTRCHVKRAGSGEPTIGFVEGIGFGVTLPQAVTNAQASANARCVNGTQARHCKARECWQGSRKIPCPRGNN